MAEREILEVRQAKNRHVSVMLARCLDLLAPGIDKPGAFVIDATLGMGGHSEALLERFDDLTVIGVDRDLQAHRLAGERLARFGKRFKPVHAVYDEIPRILDDFGLPGVDGVLFDLGVSSMQLDERERGFAYSYDAPLDMRMDATDELTASTVVNAYDESELRRIIRGWGEERFAGRIAAGIVAARQEKPLETTGDLVQVIQQTVPVAAQRRGGHPAKRTFQALRIEVNHELDSLERALPDAIDALNVGGRLVAMSYHSLEDRLVKKAITARSQSLAPRGFPVELDEHKPELRVITRGAEQPTEREVKENPRAASARLRAAEKIKSTRKIA